MKPLINFTTLLLIIVHQVRLMTKKIAPIDCPQQAKRSLKQFSQLLEDEELLRVLTHHQYARNSLVSMKNDWNNFLLFCLEKSVSPLPASVTAVRLYIEKQAKTKKVINHKKVFSHDWPLASVPFITRSNQPSSGSIFS